MLSKKFLFIAVEHQISGHPPTGKTRLDECLRIRVIAETTQEIGKLTKKCFRIHVIADITQEKSLKYITESLLKNISYIFPFNQSRCR